MTRRGDTPDDASVYLEAAKRIAEKESDYIAYADEIAPKIASLPDAASFRALQELFGGEMICFDDFEPTPETRNERVVFLCFAAAMLEAP